jgi:hypothetical protein
MNDWIHQDPFVCLFFGTTMWGTLTDRPSLEKCEVLKGAFHLKIN